MVMGKPPLLSLRDIAVGYGGSPLFTGAELHLARGDRACLIGRNGSGKSTLMRIAAGALESDAGTIYREPGLAVGWLEQEPRFAAGETVIDYIAGGGAPAHAVKAALSEFTLDPVQELGSLSGGEGRRAALARVFAGAPDLLLLDEPTNHLDLAAIEALERRLIDFRGALLVISHDRKFLANVTNRMFWLERGRLRTADRGFSHFDDWREETLHAEQRALEKLDAKLASEAHWLLHGVTARRKRNQGRMERLEQMRAQRATLIGGRGKLRMQSEEGDIRSKLVIEAERIGMSFARDGDVREVLRDFSTMIVRGDKIGIVGPNGAGKTTLLKLLIGALPPVRGRVSIAKHLALSYFDQRREQLDSSKTMRDILCPQGGDTVLVAGRSRNLRGYLKDFLFDPRQADSSIGLLSGGERNRLLLAKALAVRADLLVLDEPTNDLDTDTLDLLADILAEYSGTLLMVSHDRDFLDRTVMSTILVPGDATATEYAGGYSDAIQQRAGTARPLAKRARTADPMPESRSTPRIRRLSYNEQRELDLLPERIAALEREIAELEHSMGDRDLFTRDPELFRRSATRLERARPELEQAEHRWLELEDRRTAESGTGS
jgi:ATP-binding cassette subfamily F protein uup